MKLKKVKYNIALGVMMGVAPMLTSCGDVTMRTVVDAKGDNKLFVTNVNDMSVQYVIDCNYITSGHIIYNAFNLGDSIVGRYRANENKMYISVLPDTTPRIILDCNKINSDSAVYQADKGCAEDYIIGELIRNRRLNKITQQQK